MATSPCYQTDAVPLRKIPFALIFLLQLGILLLFIFSPLKVSLAVICGLGALIFIMASQSPLAASLILSTFFAIVLPRPGGRTYFFKVEEIFPMLALFFFLLSFFQGEYKARPVGKIGHWLLGFMIVVLIAGVSGLLQGRDRILVFDEAMMFWAWGIYFLVMKSNLSQRAREYILATLIIGALVVSLYYLYGFQILGGRERFRTDQQHIFNVSLPLLFAVLLYDTKKIRKVLAVLLMVPMVIAVYITLTRALWILVPLTILLQYLYFTRKSRRGRESRSRLLPLLIIAAIAIFGVMMLNILFGVQRLLGGRFATLGGLEYDLSLLARAELTQYVLARVSARPLLGTGFADYLRYQYFPTLGHFDIHWLDNTYLQVLWKTGIIGTVLFFGVLSFFLSRAWFVLKNADTVFDKIIGSGIFFSILTLAISGLQCGILVGYRFNFVWAILAGIIEMRASELKQIRSLASLSPK